LIDSLKNPFFYSIQNPSIIIFRRILWIELSDAGHRDELLSFFLFNIVMTTNCFPFFIFRSPANISSRTFSLGPKLALHLLCQSTFLLRWPLAMRDPMFGFLSTEEFSTLLLCYLHPRGPFTLHWTWHRWIHSIYECLFIIFLTIIIYPDMTVNIITQVLYTITLFKNKLFWFYALKK